MDVREKLVDIAERASVRTLPKNTCHTNIVMLVNALIEEGVTVQEWISVKDRLPEKDVRVLVWMNDNEEGYTQMDTDRWNCTMEQGYHWVRWGKNITHWMPLPQPPKGETIYCKDCEHLMFSDCYGKCANGHKGIVNPNDTCEHAKRKPPKGE